MGSNTFKVEGILQDIDMRLAFAHDVAGIVRARAWAMERRHHFKDLLPRMLDGRGLQTFTALGNEGLDREQEEVDQLQADLQLAA